MTAADLHKLVQGIEECVPEGMFFGIDPDGKCIEICFSGFAFSPLHASDLIAGQVKRMLPHWNSGTSAVDGEPPFWFRVGAPPNYYAPTELEALLAAYRAWKGKEKAE